MDNLNFILKLLGPIFIIVGIGIMVNKKNMVKMIEEMINSHMAMFMGGLLSFLIGLIILLSSFGLNTISEFIVSILGILALVKGVLLIIFPKQMKKLSKNIIKGLKDLLPIIGFLYLLIGLYLCWMGY